MIQYIRDIYSTARQTQRPVVSFEFFPTKTDEGERALLDKTIPALCRLNPDFCSVTYGAGGGTRDKTLAIVDRIQREQNLTSMAHLTCVNATRAQTLAFLEQTRALGIKNVLALRGDPPSGSEFTKTEDGFEYSYELVKFIREAGDFSIGVAGFPEGHVACKEGKHVDWHRLKGKIEHGADFVITPALLSQQRLPRVPRLSCPPRCDGTDRPWHSADSHHGSDQAIHRAVWGRPACEAHRGAREARR